MRILITGSGGREHALAWRLSQDEGKENIFIAPGNAGTASCGTNINCSYNDFENLSQIIEDLKIEMLVVGPEEPLVNGFPDYLKNKKQFKDLIIIGPNAKGATLEGSKDFAKNFMIRHNIPTAKFKTFNHTQKEEAISFIKSQNGPYVLKANGLAAGKGVIITSSTNEAISHISSVFENNIFGDAGKTIVIEQYLDGIEMSAFVLTDGKDYVLLPNAKDYKRIGDGDTGPNTGGMGTVSPVPFATKEFMQKVENEIIKPTISGLKKESIDYCGFIFFGLMNVAGNPYLIEYNVRMGDPETQVIMPRIGGSLSKILEATFKNSLQNIKVEILPETTLAVVIASEGYPAAYSKGKKINIQSANSIIFHAGTALADNNIVTSGGRVLAAIGTGKSINEARNNAYNIVDKIDFDGKTYRKDIGLDLLKYETI